MAGIVSLHPRFSAAAWSKVQTSPVARRLPAPSVCRRYEIDHGKIHKPGAAERHLLRSLVKKPSDIRLMDQVRTRRKKAQ
jgi:hypothetical protein